MHPKSHHRPSARLGLILSALVTVQGIGCASPSSAQQGSASQASPQQESASQGSTTQGSAPTSLGALAQLQIAATAGELRPNAAGSGWRLSPKADAAGGAPSASMRFAPADGSLLNLASYQIVKIQIRNTGPSPVTVRAKITNPDAENLSGTCQTAATLMPGARQTLDLRIMPTPEDPGFEPFAKFMKYYSLVRVRDNTVDASKIDALTVWIDEPTPDAQIEVSDVELAGTGAVGPVPFFPFVDKYGQYVHADWPGKIHSDEDFAARILEEEQERRDWPGPSEWNKYGGWATGPKLKATGNFYAAKHDGKWWLVDPEGSLFWSYGATGAGFGPDLTPISDREHWFADLPPRDGPMGKFYAEGRNVIYMYYKEREWLGYQFSLANSARKYGDNAADRLVQITAARLTSWGFNTMGAWSPAAMMASGLKPYTTVIHYGAPMVNHHQPDVFHPDWEIKVRERLERERETTAKDPMNIGYFVDNERRWGRYARFAGVSLQILEAEPTVASKIAFIDDLKAKYSTIEALNQSWGTTHASWDAMLQSREKVTFADPASPAVVVNTNMFNDCGDFGMKFGEKYFSTCRKLVKEIAPNHMYLGARLHSHIDPSLIELQAKYCEVISYNMYDATPVGRMRPYAAIDHPIMITEWGIDNDPRQSPFRATTVQVAIGAKGPRTERLAQFANDAIAHPQIVGAHFFQYRDQPLSGRPDGEALLRGFINGTDTPNFELIQVNRKITYNMYKTRSEAK